MERLVFVDVEARGNKSKPAINQIAAIATDNKLHEIAGFEAKVTCKQDATKVAREFANFLTRNATRERFNAQGELFRVAQLVAHNAKFDIEILRNWYRQQNIFLPADFLPLCTVQLAMWYFQTHELTPPKNFKLTSLCNRFNIKHLPSDAHDAFRDIRATVLLCRKLRNKLSQR